jgi:hypothetical protein
MKIYGFRKDNMILRTKLISEPAGLGYFIFTLLHILMWNIMKDNLKEKFIEAISKHEMRIDAEEITTLLHKTPWVRILLVQDSGKERTFLIEVEMSLPEATESAKQDTSVLINRLSEHLQYLQQLHNYGFELSIIGTGCIYCASKVFQKTPEDNLFRALIPP